MSAPTNPTREKGLLDWMPAFLVALAKDPNVTAAAAAVRMNRQYVYEARETHPEFAKAWDDAIEQSVDILETEARRRAMHGVSRPVYQGGALVDHVQEYSDELAIFLLKAHRPEKFRERVDVRHQGGVRILDGLDDSDVDGQPSPEPKKLEGS